MKYGEITLNELLEIDNEYIQHYIKMINKHLEILRVQGRLPKSMSADLYRRPSSEEEYEVVRNANSKD